MKPETIFLDRDGVINKNGFVNSVADFEFIDGSLEAITRMTSAGHDIFIITNQGGIEAGYLTEEDLDAIHAHMFQAIRADGGRIQDLFYCPFSKTYSDRRKPNVGMLLQAQQKYGIDFDNAYFVGDYITDFQCAHNAMIRPIAVRTGRYSEPEVTDYISKHQIPLFDDLLEFAMYLRNRSESWSPVKLVTSKGLYVGYGTPPDAKIKKG